MCDCFVENNIFTRFTHFYIITFMFTYETNNVPLLELFDINAMLILFFNTLVYLGMYHQGVK